MIWTPPDTADAIRLQYVVNELKHQCAELRNALDLSERRAKRAVGATLLERDRQLRAAYHEHGTEGLLQALGLNK